MSHAIDNSSSKSLSIVAINIRIADKAMEGINTDIIAKMKKQLETIVKMYPPFPPGSEERIKFLKEYSGLRKQIEQLTIPPDYQLAQKILSDPAQATDAGDQTIQVGNGNRSVTIRNQNISTGPQGLHIPMLTNESTDTEIAQAYDKLSAAEAKIHAKREGLAADSKSLANSIEFINMPTDVTEQDAVEYSKTVRQNLGRNKYPISNNRAFSVLMV